MGKKYLIAVDIEGIHGVVGEPYKTATDAFDYEIALHNAAKEANAIAAALFDSGAEVVSVWPNHGSPRNIDVEALDPRVELIPKNVERLPRRYYFALDRHYDGVFLIGYHAKEGTLGGVLAHTYSSVQVQYYKLNGVEYGEVELDTFVAGTAHGFSTVLVGSDDKCCAQIKDTLKNVQTVVTKYGKSRNTADLIDSETVLADFYAKTLEAIKNVPAPLTLTFPCHFEARYTRMEDAERKKAMYTEMGVEVSYGRDAHTLEMNLKKIEELEYILVR